MKTTHTFIRGLMTVILLVMIGFISSLCNRIDSGNTIEKTEKNVKAPAVDIFSACFLGDLKSVKQHISAKTDLNAKDQYGSTPLIIAATFGKTDVALALIEAGADVNIANAEGSTALHVASLFCRTEIVKALLENGADKTIINVYGATPMQGVSGSFKEAKPIYKELEKSLGALGLKFDYDYLEKTRPVVVEMLASASSAGE